MRSRALARAEGADVVDLGIVADRLDDTIAAVRRAREGGADILVTTGGASVGDYDLVQKAFAAEGMDIVVLAIGAAARPPAHARPARRHARARRSRQSGLGVTSARFLFLVPLIRRLAGRSDLTRPAESALLGCDLPENDERADYLRATLAGSPQGPVATPFPIQDSSMMAPLAKADCLVIRGPFEPATKAGSRCAIVKFER